MSKKSTTLLTLITFLVIVSVVGFVIYKNTTYPFVYIANPNTVAVISVEASPDAINLTGMFTGSTMWFHHYETLVENDSLYVQVFVSSKKTEQSGRFNISIPYSEKTLHKVYLWGENPSDQKIIWSAADNAN